MIFDLGIVILSSIMNGFSKKVFSLFGTPTLCFSSGNCPNLYEFIGTSFQCRHTARPAVHFSFDNSDYEEETEFFLLMLKLGWLSNILQFYIDVEFPG